MVIQQSMFPEFETVIIVSCATCKKSMGKIRCKEDKCLIGANYSERYWPANYNRNITEFGYDKWEPRE